MPLRFEFLLSALAAVCLLGAPADAGEKWDDASQLAMTAPVPHSKARQAKRYQAPAFYGTNAPKLAHRGFLLVGSTKIDKGKPSNAEFFSSVKAAVDLVSQRAPKIFAMMQNVNPGGRRIVHYTGKSGPATFVAWRNDYVASISASSIDDDPVFENTVYSLGATLVHEMVGHGRQEDDGRVWPMYDWCGHDSENVQGVLWKANRLGSSSGFVEYEANLFAIWFLEKVKGNYPDLNEAAVKRYVKTTRLLKKRFPGWYDDEKPTPVLLAEFGGRFRNVCPGLKFTPHLALR
ncbi:MAG: hypothetical protein H8E94_07705 [Alphaproteobacteria bacterium]|nr:hypothetical protein [Alphaproteobacteria bacterium]